MTQSVDELTWDATWRSFSAVQGGVVVGGLLGAALRAATGPPGRTHRVRTAAVHLLAPVAPEQALALRAAPDRLGATASVRVTAHQQERLCAVAQVLVSAEAGPGGDATQRIDGPRLPAGFVGPHDAQPMELPVDFVPVSQHVGLRSVTAVRPLTAPGDEPRFTVWVRVRPSAGVADELLALGLVVDVLPPSQYATSTRPTPFATVELTLDLLAAAPPVGAWLRVDQWTAWGDDWAVVDRAELHDEDGRLVAVSSQTRRRPRAG